MPGSHIGVGSYVPIGSADQATLGMAVLTVDECIEAVVTGVDIDEPALQLRLAIEEWRGIPWIEELWFEVNDEDVERILTRFLDYIDREQSPPHEVVLVLGATRDERIVPHIVDLMARQPADVSDSWLGRSPSLLVNQSLSALWHFRGEFDDTAIRDLRERFPSGIAAEALHQWCDD